MSGRTSLVHEVPPPPELKCQAYLRDVHMSMSERVGL